MKGFVRFFIGLAIVLVALLLIGIGALKFYFTEEKIITLVKPQIESITKRAIDIGGAEFSILKGFVLKDIVVKEANGKDDFLVVKEFSINYDLWPLLEKKVQVSSIYLGEPAIRIVRFKDGSFNYESLLPEEGNVQKSEVKTTGQSSKTALPVAVTLDRIEINKARISFRDELNEIPDSNAILDLNMKVKITPDGNFVFGGRLGVQASAKKNGVEAKVDGKVDFDPNTIDFHAQVAMDKWKVLLKGNVKDYMAIPKIVMDASSDALNLDELEKQITVFTSTANKNEKTKAEKATIAEKDAPILAPPIMDKMEARGKVAIGEMIYHNVSIRAITINYLLSNGILTIDKEVKQFCDGQISSHVKASLNDVHLPLDGTLNVHDVKIDGIIGMFAPQMQNSVSGIMSSDLKFSLKASPSEFLQKTLALEGTYRVKDGLIHKTPITIALSRLLGLKELEEPKFSEVKGNLKVENGWVIFKTIYSSKDVRVNVEKGRVSLDGKLDIPMVLRLSKELSRDLVKKQKALSVLLDESGMAVLPITLKGSYQKPLPTLNMKKAKDQLIKGVLKGFLGN